MSQLGGLHLPALLLQVLWVSLWLAILVVIFVPLERLFAVHSQNVFRKGILTDLGYYFLSTLLPALLLSAPVGLLAWAVNRALPASFLEVAAGLPFWARILAGLVAGEVGYYWGHRWSHQFPFLWRFHSIHHSAEQVDFMVSSRAHPVDMVFSRLCSLVPIYVLGLGRPVSAAGSEVPVLVVLISLVWGFFVHANLRWRFGPLEWLISTPAFHHWHHTRVGPINRNYSSTLPWLDWIFGTLYLPRHKWPESYGITEKIPETLVGQLVYPLRAPSPEVPATERAAAGGVVPQGHQVNEAAEPVAAGAPCLAVQGSGPELGGEKIGDASGKTECLIS
jgi:sterol desaturase/sphingolipid hydroxylase (fatty acid hydroxylase superfamily)